MQLYKKLAHLSQAYLNCLHSQNNAWLDTHAGRIEDLLKRYLPSGSGFDAGTKYLAPEGPLDVEFLELINAPELPDTIERLRFVTGFHHMDQHGGYDGWTDHIITVKPSLCHDFTVSVSGRNRNQIKDYIHDVFSSMLCTEIPDKAD